MRRRKWTALCVVLSLLLASGQDALASGPNQYGWKLPELQKDKSVPTTDLPPVRGKSADQAAKSAVTKPDPVSWPAESQTEVEVGAGASAKAGLVSLRRAGNAAARSAKSAKVRVDVKGQDAAKKLGLHGILLTVADAGGAADAPVKVDVDYQPFATAFGGDYASRLRLVSLPACALSTPDKPECRRMTPVPGAENDRKAGKVSAEVTPDPSASSTSTQRAASTPTVLAVAAAPSGGNGTFSATSLAPAGSWNAGGSSGDFAYGYPVRVPPAVGGAAPTISLGYSSQSLDGRTSSTNNQASIVGDGWDISPGGFIERQFKPCGLDLGGNNGQTKTGDQCWATDNVTISLVGVSGQLIKNKDLVNGQEVWRAKNDDGARIEHLLGAANGDNDGEHWKVTTTDGTQYFLGLNRLPGWTAGKPETQSAWTEPVYGNNDGEPCKQSTFDASWCQQAYRWNVDYSVDPHGNVTTYYYEPEINYYGRNADPAKGTAYVRGGQLRRIEYGLRDNDVYGTAGARVWFDTAERCLPNGQITCDPGQLNPSTASSWPDVPADQLCNAGEQCTNRLTPSFFTRKRLTKITTQVANGNGGFDDVDSWSLTQDFPATGDGTSPAMNLKSIVHTGLRGGSISLPATTFDRKAMSNRVDSSHDNLSPLTRYRITGVNNEAGARTEIRYSEADCVQGTRMPSPTALQSNNLRCYPTWWTPEGAPKAILDYFHKYVVTDVVDDDRTGASSLVKTHYDYVGDPAWHFDENDFAEADKRTWSQWRGYGTVRVVKGDSSEKQSVAETVYLRGMDGATVSTSEGEPIQDVQRLQGFVRETRQYNNGQLVSASVNDPWMSDATATGADGKQAKLSNVEAVRGRTLLESGKWRRTKVVKTYDSVGIVTKAEDHGDVDVTGDESCSRTTFARNDAAWMLSYASQVETVKGLCDVQASSSSVLSIAKSYFDGKPWGEAPTKGDITRAEVLDKWDGGGQKWVTASTSTFDAYGRPLEVVDATNQKTTTAYSPVSGPLTQVTSTNALGHVSTGYFDPAWGASIASVDANGRRADLEYDALGRLTKAWTPGHPKATAKADAEFVYTYNTNAPSVVAAKRLQDDNTYMTSYTLYDGLFRERQTQSPSPAGGRLISDTFYDSRGLPYKTNGAYWNEGQAPGSTLSGVFDNDVPNQTVTEYDGMERPTASIYRKFAAEQWRTTTSYGGDRVHTTPPQGSAATTVISDAQGRTTEKRQYTNGLGSAFDATKYAYTPAGQLSSVTDPAGNAWRYTYDLRGRKISADDPDTGHSETEYDAAGRILSTTDGRNRKVTFTYDALSRKTASFEGTTKLAEWQYDTVSTGGQLNGRGMLTLSRRWVNGQAYTRRITGYDGAGRPAGERVTIPSAAEGALGGTYEASSGYTYTGKLQRLTYLDVNSGDTTVVPGESVVTAYNSFGLPDYTVSGEAAYVSETNYSSLGEVLRETYDDKDSPNNLTLTNSYELGTRRLERTIADRETPTAYRVADRNYSYDAAGNINRVADTPEGGPSDIQCFAYDYLRRMTSAWTPGSGDCSAAKSTSALGGVAPYWMSWTFDKTGNRLTQTSHASAGDTVNSFTYPAAGGVQPHTVSKVDTTGPNGTSQDSFAYDAAGNTTSRKISGNTQTLEYDVEGRVSKVKNADGKESTYLYDADGGRLIAREPSATTLFVFGQEVRLEAGTTTPSWTRYYSHNGHVVAQRNSISGLKWLVTDHQGTEIAAVTAGNLAVASRRQTPFGESRGGAASWNQHGFVGGTREESGLTRVGARLYDSSAGRFLSADPIVDNNDPQQLNGYAYSNNSPVTFSDPTGLLSGGQCGPDGILCGGGRENYQSEQQYRGVQNFFKQERTAQVQQSAAKRQAFEQGLRDAGISQREYEEAQKNAHKSKWDVIKEVAWEMLKDISGWNDIVDCFTKGDIWACGGLVMNLVPWGKVGKVLEAGYKAVRATMTMAKIISKAQGLLRRVEKITAAAQEIAMNAIRKLGGKSDVGGSCLLHSFVAGTRVLMADGSSKPIDEIHVGDKVKATDPASGVTSDREVVDTIVHTDEGDMTRLSVAGGTVDATSWHPVWVEERGDFAKIGTVKPGEHLRSADGTLPLVSSVEHYNRFQPVYDLTIEDVHTYHVIAGHEPVLVHNCGDEIPDTLYHYTNEAGHDGILASQELRPSLKANNPKDARYGDGQYLTDIEPGSKTPGQLSAAFLRVPWAGQKFTHYVAIDVRGLDVAVGRPGVFVVLGDTPLDLAGRILGSGRS